MRGTLEPRMNSLGRSFMWWPGMTAAVEEKVKICSPCQFQRKLPAGLGVAPAPVVKAACRLCWSIHGADVFDCCGRTFQVA